jgi:hypothetical protein
MPTVNEVLGGLLQKAINNPKTTAQSFLTCFLTLVPTLLAVGAIHGKAAAIAGSLLAVAKVWVGATQHDGVVIPPGTEMKQTTSVTTPQQ